MNLWECQQSGCKITATGIGSASGLSAIGWYFHRGQFGPVILCPVHHPEEKEGPMIQELKHADLVRLLVSSAMQVAHNTGLPNTELQQYQEETLRRLQSVCEHELRYLLGGPACEKCGWTP